MADEKSSDDEKQYVYYRCEDTGTRGKHRKGQGRLVSVIEFVQRDPRRRDFVARYVLFEKRIRERGTFLLADLVARFHITKDSKRIHRSGHSSGMMRTSTERFKTIYGTMKKDRKLRERISNVRISRI